MSYVSPGNRSIVNLKQVQRIFGLLLLVGLVLIRTVVAENSNFSSPNLVPIPDSTGHRSIGYQESTIGSVSAFVPFSTLKQWDFSREKPDVPDVVQALHGRRLALVGFMFPLQEGDNITAFLLMATTQTCCFGPRPEFTQFILAESEQPVEFVRLRPVLVEGDFFVEPKPDDGYLFRLQVTAMTPAAEQKMVARETFVGDLPELLWDFLTPLQEESSLVNIEDVPIPASISALVGVSVKVSGHLIGIDKKNGLRVQVAKHYWDGCCTGIPPGSFDSFWVEPSDPLDEPQAWHKSGTISGRLEIVPPAERRDQGLIRLRDAAFALLSDQFDLPDFPEVKRSLFLEAVDRGDVDLVKLFLRAGTNVQERGKDGISALHIAAGWGHIPLLPLLQQAGLSPDIRDRRHQTPIFAAISHQNREAVAYLASAGADLNATDSLGFSPLLWATAIADADDLPIMLAERGADLTLRNAHGKTARQIALDRNRPALAERLTPAPARRESPLPASHR